MQMGIAASSYAQSKSWDGIFRGLLDQYETVLQHRIRITRLKKK